MARSHREVEAALRASGWTPCGAGDWAVALRSPSGTQAARISPFDPCSPYTARVYREAAHTGFVPRLDAEEDLDGGGSLLVMEFLEPVDEATARGFLRSLEGGELSRIIAAIHDQARRELPWCGPLDDNPSNVMRTLDGRLVRTDPYFADGPTLYRTVLTDPDRVARAIPPSRRRHMLDIPLAGSGGWDEEGRARMTAALAAADARL